MSNENVSPGRPLTIVFIGVAGSGKTTAAKLFAQRLSWPYFEADAFHSEANIRKMSSGIPLDDCDRLLWLKTIAHEIGRLQTAGQDAVFTCSALKRSYRQMLDQPGCNIRFVYLSASPDLLRERLLERKGHFMKLEMLESQLEALVPPQADEALVIDAGLTPDRIVDVVRAACGL